MALFPWCALGRSRECYGAMFPNQGALFPAETPLSAPRAPLAAQGSRVLLALPEW